MQLDPNLYGIAVIAVAGIILAAIGFGAILLERRRDRAAKHVGHHKPSASTP